MPEPFELPEDITALSAEDLDTTLAQAIEAFQGRREDPNLTTADMPALRALGEGIKAMKAERESRTAEAATALAELDNLAAEVGLTVEEPEPEPAAEPGAEVAEPVVEPEPQPEPVTAAVARRPALNLAAVRSRQQPMPQAPEPEPPSGITLRASVDMPGLAVGTTIDMDTAIDGVINRANSLATKGRGGSSSGSGLVASYALPFTDDLIVKDASNPYEGSLAVIKAADQKRLSGGDLVASGGWCAPSETLYNFTGIACPDMLWDAPEIQMSRGGLRFFQTPTLDVAAMTFDWTEANDIAASTPGGPTKPCFKVPCPTPTEVRCTAYGTCVEAGILTQRHFPELVQYYVQTAMVAHEINLRQSLYEAARTASTAVTTAVSFAAFSAVYGAVALQAADMIERLNLCDNIGLEVVFPWWARNMFLADIARQQDVSIADLNPNIIQDAFSSLGVRVQFARGLTPDVPTNIGGATAATAWPADIEFLIYPSGTFQIGRGAEVNLGVIHAPELFQTNDYSALFSEECAALAVRNAFSRRVTVAVCASGAVGPRATPVCPVA